LLQFANLLLVVTADLLLLGDRVGIDQLLAELLFPRNANFVVDNPVEK
jgi:hypothetical protein